MAVGQVLPYHLVVKDIGLSRRQSKGRFLLVTQPFATGVLRIDEFWDMDQYFKTRVLWLPWPLSLCYC